VGVAVADHVVVNDDVGEEMPTSVAKLGDYVPPDLTKDQVRQLLIDFLDRLIASKPPAKAPE
jgi:hypothetical protein